MGIRVDRLKRERKGVKYFSGDGDERFENRLYNDLSKEYWNKSSGKWVKRSFKNYVDEFFSFIFPKASDSPNSVPK
jgi:hypothetical protein